MFGSLMLTLSGRLLVDGDVEVGGRVGRERLVKLSQQVVLLDQRTKVTGECVKETRKRCKAVSFYYLHQNIELESRFHDY